MPREAGATAPQVALQVPAIGVEVRRDGVLVRISPMRGEAGVLAACLEHAAAQLRVLSAAALASHGRDATIAPEVVRRGGKVGTRASGV